MILLTKVKPHICNYCHVAPEWLFVPQVVLCLISEWMQTCTNNTFIKRETNNYFKSTIALSGPILIYNNNESQILESPGMPKSIQIAKRRRDQLLLFNNFCVMLLIFWNSVRVVWLLTELSKFKHTILITLCASVKGSITQPKQERRCIKPRTLSLEVECEWF